MKYLNKFCDLDPVPTWLLKKYLDHTVPLVSALVIGPLTKSAMPRCLKCNRGVRCSIG